MCLIYLNYIFCIACLKVTGLTPSHSWSISCIVQVLVRHIGLSLGALLPQLLGWLELNQTLMTESQVRSNWTWSLLNRWNFVKLMVGVFVGFILESAYASSKCWSHLSPEPGQSLPFARWWRVGATYPTSSALLTLGLLVPLNHPHLMTILTCILPLGQFKRSKLLYELI